MSPSVRASLAILAASVSLPTLASAQQNQPLPRIVVEAPSTGAPPSQTGVAGGRLTWPLSTAPGQSLTVPTIEQATNNIMQTPGAVAIVPDAVVRNTPAQTVKDIFDYIPGVIAQPKWGEDSRFSIRGSGLSRNFHLRGIQLYMDGIPINTSDGYGDFQEIDPTAYRFVEVYKGANALRLGANSLGGAVNFVMPTGRDASPAAGRFDCCGFGLRRLQASSGGVYGPADYFVTGSWLDQDGFRDHSWGESFRGSANVGYQFSPDAETRFYINANSIRQRIPGSVTRATALTSPQTAAAINVINDWQRNIDSIRLANKTVVRIGENTAVEFGAFGVDRHLMHPIFQWLDYRYNDYGGFARVVDERTILGRSNRLVAGVNLLNGVIDADQFANTPGAVKGLLLSRTRDSSVNLSAYAENSFYFVRPVAFVAGMQYLFATRDREVILAQPGIVPGKTEFSIFNPKIGILWDVAPRWQVFANVSRSAEVPSFGESSNFPAPVIPFTSIKAQTATTYEIGTRGRRPDYAWDVALYRADIKNELLCFFSSFGNCNVTNANRTVHQGLELGFGVTLVKELFVPGPLPDRLWLNLAYTFNDFRFDKDPTFGNNELPGAPRHFLRAELLYKHPSGVYLGPNIEWVPEAYFVDSANTLLTESYLIWGLKLGYDDGKRYSAYIEGRNLSNKAYIASASIINVATPTSPLFEPGSGRAVFAGIRGRL
jgi:iron complex outermembrane recepter protein